MKTYNRPISQIEEFKTSYMLMQNVSGCNLQGIHQGEVPDPIIIY